MTMPTAQGARMRCDYAGCTNTGTVERDAWTFCTHHADAHDEDRAATAAPRPAPRIPASAPMPQVLGGGTIGLLLEQASGHSSKRVQALANRIEAQLEQLRAMIAARAEDEKRKRAETMRKQKARADIAELEAKLAAAKALLRGQPAPAAPAARSGSNARVLEQLPCRKGCGKISNGAAGRSGHERHCTHDAATR